MKQLLPKPPPTLRGDRAAQGDRHGALTARRTAPLSRTAPFRAELERAFPERPFAVHLWDGSTVEATAPGPTFFLRSPQAMAHLLRAPGELGLGRAYVQGLLDVDDIDAAIRVVEDWQAPPIPPRRWLGLAAGAVRAAGLIVPPRRPKIISAELGDDTTNDCTVAGTA